MPEWRRSAGGSSGIPRSIIYVSSFCRPVQPSAIQFEQSVTALTSVPVIQPARSLDAQYLTPRNVRRPKEGARRDTFPFDVMAPHQLPLSRDPKEGAMAKMGRKTGDLPQNKKGRRVGKFNEYVAFAMRWFGRFATTLGAGFYLGGPGVEFRGQPPSRREIMTPDGIRLPLTGRISKASPLNGWCFEYGPTHEAAALTLNNFAPLPASQLEEFRLRC